jgi:uncharacterized protein
MVNLLDISGVNPIYYQTQKGKQPMIIKLYEIEDEVRVEGEVKGAKFQRPEDTELKFLSPITYALKIEKIGEDYRVTGKVHGSLSLSCARCLDEFNCSVDSTVDIELMRRPKDFASELELRDEEMDVCYFDGDEVDLDPYVYEEVILSMPIQALCSDACRGMCPQCGKNLNREECRCDRAGASLLGDKLKTFLNNTKGEYNGRS